MLVNYIHLYEQGASGPGGAEFAEFKKESEEKHNVTFHTSLDTLPPIADGMKRLALISGRTVDNPRLLNEAIKVRVVQNSCQFLVHPIAHSFFF